MNALFAAIDFHSWGLVDWIIAVIVIVAVAAIAYTIITKGFGMTIPAWVVTVFWIVVACVVGIGAIRIVASL